MKRKRGKEKDRKQSLRERGGGIKDERESEGGTIEVSKGKTKRR